MIDTHQTELPRIRFSIASALLVMAAVAVIFWLGYALEEHGGIVLAVLICVLPFAILTEFAFQQRPAKESVPWKQKFQRLSILILCSIAPALAAEFGFWDGMQWWSPGPVFSVAFYALLDEYSSISIWMVVWLPAVIFFLGLAAPAITNRQLNYLPLRSLVLLSLTTITSIVWFSFGISGSRNYQSPRYVSMCLACSGIVILLLWGSWLLLRRRFNVPLVILWNIVLVSWLFWIAHPWLGEYP